MMEKFAADLLANMVARGLTKAQAQKAVLAVREEMKRLLPLRVIKQRLDNDCPSNFWEEELMEAMV